jgi:uncharacterized membrane protein YbhN (UPF0104 family)
MTSAVLTRPEQEQARPAATTGRRAFPRRWWGRVTLLVIAGGLAAVELHGRLPDPASTWAVLRLSAPGPLLVAAVLQVTSMTAFAEQQRQLLAAYGVKMSTAAALGLTYTRSAISIALPGGSAVSAGYAFRAYRARGASRQVGVAVMVLSGVASVTGLALLYVADVLAWITPSPATLAALVAVPALVALTVRHLRRNRPPRRPVARHDVAAPTSRLARLRDTVRETVALAARIPTPRWVGILVLAALNWATDVACLLAAIHAVGVSVPARDLATAYLAIQLIRQIPVTPGGVGVVEASLVVALTATGAAPAPAAAAVILYRLLSCWGLLPVGLLCWMTQRHAEQANRSARPDPVGIRDVGAHGAPR